MAATSLDDVDGHLRQIISNLYMLIVQAHDYQGAGTHKALDDEIKRLISNLVQLSRAADRLPTRLPLDIIQYVENSRNPDIYTREFVELVMKYNQQLKGRSEAFASFRDVLGAEMMSGIPDIREETRSVVQASGGRAEQ